MYIVNSQESVSTDVYDYLPKATCETLDYYLATYLSYNAVYDLEKIKRVTEPSETHITPSIKYVAESKNIEFPKNTIISTTGEYTLNSKINVEIVDTYPIQYVIIKGNEKTVYRVINDLMKLGATVIYEKMYDDLKPASSLKERALQIMENASHGDLSAEALEQINYILDGIRHIDK